MRSEAKKAADKRYTQKIKGKYRLFSVNFIKEEFEKINNIVKFSGMTKADFIRWAVKKLEDEGV